MKIKNVKKNNKWLIVTNKLTYLLFLTVPIGLLKMFLYDIKFDDMVNMITQIFISIIIAFLGIYFFIKLNSYSEWMNHNHPKPDDN